MSSWADRLDEALRRWDRGETGAAVALLREVAASGDPQAAPEASHRLAQVLQAGGDLAGARAAHRAVVDSGHPLFAQRSALALGLLMVDDEEWAAAHRALTLASEGGDPEICALADTALGHVLARLGDPAGARAALERAARSTDPEVAELAGRLGASAAGLDAALDPETARAALEHATGLADRADRGDEEAADEAEAVFRHLLTCGDAEVMASAAFGLHDLLVARGRYAAAREAVEHAVAVGRPEDLPVAYRLLGAVLAELGEYAEAREAYRRAAQDARPEHRLPALVEEGRLASRLGDDDAAAAIFHRVIAAGHDEHALRARACLAHLHTEAGRTDEALAAWRAVLEDEAQDDDGYAEQAVLALAALLRRVEDGSPEHAAVLDAVRIAADHRDPDVAYRARLLQAHAAVRAPLSDPDAERAVQDTDRGLDLLRDGDLAGARRLLRRAVDSGTGEVALRAEVSLALLELGEGDADQAEELLAHVAEAGDVQLSLLATVYLHALRSPLGARHPVLRGPVDHQRLGRELGVASWQEAAADGDAAAAPAKAMLAQLLSGLGLDLATTARMYQEVIDSGDPLALSYAVLAYEEPLVHQGRRDEAVTLLRRAHREGHPLLAPWAALRLGCRLAEGDDDLPEARRALEAALAGLPAVRDEAAGALLGVLERLDDLPAMCALYERVIAEAVAADDAGRAARHAWLLGLTLVRTDDPAAAREAFARVPQDDPQLALCGLYARLLLDGDFDAAVRALIPVQAYGDDDPRYWMATRLALECAHAWQRAGDTASADAALSLVLAAGHPEYEQEAAGYLGALRREAGDLRGAVTAWRRAAATGDNLWIAGFALHGVGCCLHDLGDPDGAAEAFRRVLEGERAGDGEAEEHVLDAARRLGEILAGQNRAAEAREILDRFFGDAAPLLLGAALDAAGHHTEAAAVLRETAADPHSPAAAVAAFNLGHSLARAGDVDGAAEAFERAAVDGSEVAGHALVALGDHLREAGDDAGARAAFERAARDADETVARRARRRLGTATALDRAWLLLTDDADREGALAAFTEVHGSADLARLIVALHDGDVEAARRPAERLAGDDRAYELVLRTAHELDAAGQAGEAAKLYELAVASGGPRHAGWALLGLAAQAADRADVAEAERLCLRVTAHDDPELAGTAWDNLRVLRLRRDDVPAAVQAARRAVDCGRPPVVTRAGRWLADVLEESGDLDGAREVLTRAAAVDDPGATAALRALVLLLQRQGDDEALAEAAGRAIDGGDPETVAMAYSALAYARRARGDDAGAAELLRRAIAEGDPESAAVFRLDLAGLLRDGGDRDAALREYETALRSGEPVAVAMGGPLLGEWLHEEGDLAGAAGAFAAAAAVDAEPGSRLADWTRGAMNRLSAIARQADEAGDHAAAAHALTLAARAGAYDDAVQAARTFADAHAAGGDVDTARRYLEAAVGFDPARAPARRADLAAVLAAGGEVDEARAILTELQDDEDADVRVNAGIELVRLLIRAGDEDAAYAVARRQSQDADSPVASMMLGLLGHLQMERGEHEEALRTLRAAADDDRPLSVFLLAQTLEEQGEVAEARDVYRRLAEGGDPEFAARAMVALGQTYHDEDETQARRWYLRAVDAGDADLSPTAAMYLGALGKRARDFDAALPWYQRVIDAGHCDAGLAAAHLGELCYWLGDRDGAVRYYELTLSLTDLPDLVAEAAYRLGEIRHRDGDLPAARTALLRALETEDATFAPQARALLSRLP
ncbi:tetratricopeptide repeat protein [Actinomadura sp. NPDC047616]|uniref:tetratricopeptide repeat protein n=1 Tax=Actinomadura sp. NPDC047616 TaxID=3155914 RepID=UPI0033C6FFC4